MKTLYEGILADMDDTLTSGEEYINVLDENFNNLKKDLSLAKSYREVKTYNPKKFVINRYCKNLLKSFGFDAELLFIAIYLPGAYGANALANCEVIIQLMKYQNKGMHLIYKTDYTLSGKEYGSLNDVIKKFIKPHLKDINTLKKFITK